MTQSIFVAGDLHIPSRATMLHPKFQFHLENQKWDYIVLTGDLTTPKVLEFFKKHIKNPSNLIACRGNMDKFALPEKPVFEINKLKMGAYHGMGVHPRGNISQLKEIASDMKVKILFTGHSHKKLLHIDNEHIILNPGTSTGASGGSDWTVDTGIIILNIEKDELIIKFYSIDSRGKIKEKKLLHTLSSY